MVVYLGWYYSLPSVKAPVEKNTGAALTVQWEKMSKSKYNGVDPQVSEGVVTCKL